MKENEKPQENLVKPIVEPKSAHSSPVVEKYVRKRKNKAEKQIVTEQEHTEN